MDIHQQTQIYKNITECEIRADVWWDSDPPRRSPVVIWLHGGALVAGSRRWLEPQQLRRYLSHGYAVVAVDYRLAPETKLPAIIEDLQEAYRWVRTTAAASYPIDPERIGVIGHSAGGYLALMLGFCVSPRPRVLVSFYGYGDIIGAWYSEPDPFYCQQPAVSREQAYAIVGEHPISEAVGDRSSFYLYLRQQGLWPLEVGGRDPRQEPEFFQAYCPLQHVTSEYPPTLLLHGDRDTDVPHQQSALMAQALARAGVFHRFLTIPGAGHAFDANPDQLQVQQAFETVTDFLDWRLKPASQG